MLNGGEDPLYLARRIVRMAVEDIGQADPLSILVANAAKDTYDFLGSPEGELALAQAVVHLATAPKSVGVYEAFKAAKKAAHETGSLMPPAHIRNAPTKLMKSLGYGKGYQYDPDTPEGFSGADFFPDEMERRTFYKPKGEGHEEKVKARLERWAAMRARMQADKA
jgi:putative ATPase